MIAGVDDGAQATEEATELLRLDWEEGIRVAFATPHYGEENIGAPARSVILEGFNRLTEVAKKMVPGMRLSLGTEWYCSEDIVERVRNKEAWPINDSD